MHFLRKIIVLFIATGSLTLGIQNAAAAGMGCSPLNKPSRYTDNRFDRSRSAAPWDFRQAPRPTYRPPVPMGPMPVWNRYARHANPGHGYPRRHGPMRHIPPHRWGAQAYRGHGHPKGRPAPSFSPPRGVAWGMPGPRSGAPFYAGGIDPRSQFARYPYPPMGRYAAQPNWIQPPYPGMPGPGTRNRHYGQGNQNNPARWRRQVYRPAGMYRPLPPRAYGYRQPGGYGRPPVYAYRGPVWQPPRAWHPINGRPHTRSAPWGPYYAMPHGRPGMRERGPFPPMATMPRTGSGRHTPAAARIGTDTRREPAPATPVSSQSSETGPEMPTAPNGSILAVPVSPVKLENNRTPSEKPAAPVAEDRVDRLPGMGDPIDSPSPQKPGRAGRTAGSTSPDSARGPETTGYVPPTTGFPDTYPASAGKRQTTASKIGDKWIFRGGQADLAPEDQVESAAIPGALPNGRMSVQLTATPLAPTLAAGGRTLLPDH